MSKKNRRNNGTKSLLVIAAAALLFVSFFIYKAYTEKQNELPGGYAEMDFIDVGQGDACLVVCDGLYMMIDAGPGSHEDELVEYLRSAGVQTLEYVIFTHPHEDHIGGADKLLDTFGAERVIMPDAVTTTKTFEKLLNSIEACGADVIQATAGAEYSLGGLKITLLAPNSEKYSEMNNYSVVARLDYGDCSVIMTGDAETLSEEEILEKFKFSLDADILKVGHHGSDTSSSRVFLDAVSPAFAVISCGEGNSYGHPDAVTLNALEAVGAEILRTDKDGTVIFRTDGKSITRK